MYTAHYFKSSKGAKLLISNSPTGEIKLDNRVCEIAVSGKREARKIAAQHNAKEWNF